MGLKEQHRLPTLERRRMDALASIEAIIRDLLIFVVAMTTLLIALLVIVSRMPDDNPLKRILVALSYRVGATAAAGLIAAPATPIPGLDAVIDIGAPILLLWYWWTFFRGLWTDRSRTPARKAEPTERP
jgi:branched-subunit amino acid permease